MVGSLVLAASASAEIVFLTSGRTLSVKGHRVDGDRIVCTPERGEVTCDKTLVDKIKPDEVPYPRTRRLPGGRGSHRGPPIPEAAPYGEIITAVSETHGVDPLLVRALIPVESGYPSEGASSKARWG